MNANPYPQLKLDRWMPRCFDLTESGGVEDLMDAIERTSATLLIQKAWATLDNNLRSTVVAEYEQWQKLLELRFGAGFRKRMGEFYGRLRERAVPSPFQNTALVTKTLIFVKYLFKVEQGINWRGFKDYVKSELQPRGGATGPDRVNKLLAKSLWDEIVAHSRLDSIKGTGNG